MPYKDNESLPDTIKSALPTKAQDLFRNAFNGAYAKDSDEAKCNKIAWGAVKNAGYEKGENDKWSKKENFTIDNVEIFSIGTWKGDTYDGNDLQEIVNNFSLLKDEIKPMLHIGHDRALENDSQPALGWMSNLKTNGKKLLATFTDVPKIVYEAIRKRLYARISSEILWGLKHTGTNKKYGKVLTGVAILGASIPAVRTLRDLSVFTLDTDGRKIYNFNVENGTIGGDIMPQDELKKYIDDLNEANKKATDALTTAKEYKEKLDAMEAQTILDNKNRDIENIKTYCEDQVKAGKLAPAARDLIIQDIDKKTYTETDKISFGFEQVKNILEKQYTLDMSEKGSSKNTEKADNPEDQIDIDVKKYMKTNKISYTEAMTDLLNNDPAFAKMYEELKYSDEK